MTWITRILTAGLLLCMAVPSSATDTFDALPRKANSTEIRWVRAALETQLKDADSARLKGLKVITSPLGEDQDYTVCGLVNAKNGYGAYTGYSAINALLSAKRKLAYDVDIDTAQTDGVVARACESALKMTLLLQQLKAQSSTTP